MALQAGGAIILTIFAAQHPVVSMGVSPAEDPIPGKARGHQLYEAYHAALGVSVGLRDGDPLPFGQLEPPHQAFWHRAAELFAVQLGAAR